MNSNAGLPVTYNPFLSTHSRQAQVPVPAPTSSIREYSEQEDTDTDGTSTDSGSESESESESEHKPDPRMDALAAWRQTALTRLGPVSGAGAASSITKPGNPATALGIYNTSMKFEQARQTHILMLDSLDRDQQVWPLPTQLRLRLPRVYKNVERIDIVQLKFINGLYGFTAARGNTTLWVQEVSGGTVPLQVQVTVPDGTYTICSLCETLTALLNVQSPTGLTYYVSYNPTTGRVSVSATGPFTLLLKTKITSGQATAYSGWGLGWNLGFGGAPQDVSGSLVTATCLPRLFDDYVFLRLNDSEQMNTVDHTELEVGTLTQTSTGQVDHYFGKLLLNSFGCWSQTFVEAPRRFQPVLGRLERLSVDWLDRWGRVLTGPDAVSCDWHMTVRIVEVVERPMSTSTLTGFASAATADTAT